MGVFTSATLNFGLTIAFLLLSNKKCICLFLSCKSTICPSSCLVELKSKQSCLQALFKNTKFCFYIVPPFIFQPLSQSCINPNVNWLREQLKYKPQNLFSIYGNIRVEIYYIALDFICVDCVHLTSMFIVLLQYTVTG